MQVSHLFGDAGIVQPLELGNLHELWRALDARHGRDLRVPAAVVGVGFAHLPPPEPRPPITLG